MTVPSTTQAWILTNPPLDKIESDFFTLESRPIETLKDGQVLIQVQYLSNDPAQRGWMQRDVDPKRLYVKPIVKGDVVRAGGLGFIISSKSGKFKVGDRVTGSFEWAQYIVRGETEINPIVTIEGFSPSVNISLLATTGLTAWAGIYNVGQLKAGQTLLVSGAAGATGSTVIQLAKNLIGASRVVGIAGGADKCQWVESLGADKCLDYKSATFEDELKNEVEFDCYFDNIGGSILNAALPKIKKFGKIVSCGAIAGYNDKAQHSFPNWFEIISNRITIEGFVVHDNRAEWPAVKAELAQSVRQGKLAVNETIIETKFEDVPKTWMGLFEGRNKGKLVTHLTA